MNSKEKTNFPPKIWGPGVWFLLHLSALRFPSNPTIEDKKNYSNFIKSLQYVLPCEGCCKGFKTILEMTKFGAKDLKNQDTLFAWTVKAHSIVNVKTGKQPRDDPDFWKKQYMKLAI